MYAYSCAVHPSVRSVRGNPILPAAAATGLNSKRPSFCVSTAGIMDCMWSGAERAKKNKRTRPRMTSASGRDTRQSRWTEKRERGREGGLSTSIGRARDNK